MATIEEIYRIIENKWKRQGVKYVLQDRKPVWIKTLRTVDCAICKKHLQENREDEGFDDWTTMDIFNPQGKMPEVCPDCAKVFDLPQRRARMVICKRCHTIQKEKIYGIGFPGWFITNKNRTGLLTGFCPNCFVDYVAPKIPEFIHSTWYNLTFPSGSLLTSTKMTQLDGNLDALAAQESGAPVIRVGGTVLQKIFDEEEYWSGTGGSWKSRFSTYVYINPNVLYLKGYMYAREEETSADAKCRLYIDESHVGGATSEFPTSLGWRVIPGMDVSDLEGWYILYIQLYTKYVGSQFYVKTFNIVGSDTP